MKVTLRLLAGLLAAAVAAPLGAQDIKIKIDPNKPADASKAGPPATPATPAAAAAPTAPAAPPVPAIKYTDEQKLEVWGFVLASQTGIAQLGFTEAEFKAIVRGMTAAIQGEKLPYDPQQIGPQVRELLSGRQEKLLTAVRDKNIKDAAMYLDGLKGKPQVVTLPSGLRYEILKAGTGAKPRADQTVKVNYVGTLISGETFDSSEAHGGPVDMVLAKVVPGWSEGLQLMQQGSKFRLYVPPPLAFGDEGAGPIPPGALLIFEAELLEVKDTPKEAPVPAAPAK